MSDDDDDDREDTDPRGERAAPPSRPSWDKRLDRATWDRMMGRGDRPGPIITGDPLFAPPEPPPAAADASPAEPAEPAPAGPPWDRRITREDWQRLFENAEQLPELAPEAPLAEGSGWMHNSDAFAKLAIADGSGWGFPEGPGDSGAVPSGVGGPAESSEFPEIRVEAAAASSARLAIAVEPAREDSGAHEQLPSDLVTTAPAHRSAFPTSLPGRLPSDFVSTLSLRESQPALSDAAELGVTDVPSDEGGASQLRFISRDQIDALEAGASGALPAGVPDDAVTTWQQLKVEDLEELAQAADDLEERVTAPAPSGTTRGRVVRPTPPGSLYGGRRFAPPAPRQPADDDDDQRATTRAERDQVPPREDPPARDEELALDRPPPPLGIAVAVRRPPSGDDELHRRAMRRAVFGEAAPRDDHDTVPVERVDDDSDDEPPRGAGGGGKAKAGTLLAVLALAMLVALFAACAGPPSGVVLWHAYNGVEREALESSADRWNAAHPDMPLELVAVPYSAFGDKLTSAIPGGNGPDLFIYSQDRIGAWASANIIEPIEFWLDDAHLARFSAPAVAAMAYADSLYGLPLATKSLALFYRTDLVAAPPATTDDLLALAPRMKARDGYAIAYTNVDLYGHAPWLFGFGGSIMNEAGELSIASPAAASAMDFARELVATGAAPDRAEGPLVATLFNEGKAATAISGPWFVADIKEGVPWKVATLPVVSATGTHASPFLGAEGILMSARARDKNAAFAVMDALVSDENATERARRAGQVVPNRAAYDDPKVARDPVLNAFREQLLHTVPMPKAAAMRMVWIPYKTALGEVLAGRKQPGPQLRSVEREVQNYLDGRSK